MQFVRVNPDGSTSFAGWAPHLDLEPLADADRPLLKDLLDAPWIRADQEQKAVALAAATLVPEHFKEVADRRVAHVDKTLAAVHERLTKEIAFWSDRWIKLKDDLAAGKDVRLNLDNVQTHPRTTSQGRLGEPQEGTAGDAARRRTARRSSSAGRWSCRPGCSASSAARGPRPVGRRRRRPQADRDARHAGRHRGPRRRKGHRVVDVSAEKCGWDLTSYPPAVERSPARPAAHRGQGPREGGDTVTVTRNEILYAFNQGDKFVLAIVFVNPDDSIEGPYYLAEPVPARTGLGRGQRELQHRATCSSGPEAR